MTLKNPQFLVRSFLILAYSLKLKPDIHSHQVEAEKIYNLGFENLILATGSHLNELPSWIREQQSKDYPN